MRTEISDMVGRIETTTREAWEKLVDRYAGQMGREFRREHGRRNTSTGSVKLAFEREGKPVKRTGNLLEFSWEGVQIKQREEITVSTLVLMHVMLSEGEATLAGRVVHCTDTLGGFKVGIQLLFDGDKEE
jgi:hypothetical protein